jgi:hypothetical protein
MTHRRFVLRSRHLETGISVVPHQHSSIRLMVLICASLAKTYGLPVIRSELNKDLHGPNQTVQRQAIFSIRSTIRAAQRDAAAALGLNPGFRFPPLISDIRIRSRT